MLVVLGASGHTGQVVARNLLSRGQKVRVVGRSADRLRDLAAKGAEVFVADAVLLTPIGSLINWPRKSY